MNNQNKNTASLTRGRLQKKAKETGRPFMELLQYYAMERFLYRLSNSKYKDYFVLKGALIFLVFQIPERRTTIDIDFLGYIKNEISKMEKIFKEICGTKVLNDGLIFDPETVVGNKIKEGADYEGIRIKFKGYLEKSRIPMQVDIAFGDIVLPRPTIVEYPTILDLPNPRLKGYSINSLVAEKLESMIKLGSINSRMKDFYDIWLISGKFNFEGKSLVHSIKKTFSHRRTELPKGAKLLAEEFYDELSDRQLLWKAFIRKNQLNYTPGKLKYVVKVIERFMNKPIKAIHDQNEFNYKWEAPGPWKLH